MALTESIVWEATSLLFLIRKARLVSTKSVYSKTAIKPLNCCYLAVNWKNSKNSRLSHMHKCTSNRLLQYKEARTKMSTLHLSMKIYLKSKLRKLGMRLTTGVSIEEATNMHCVKKWRWNDLSSKTG